MGNHILPSKECRVKKINVFLTATACVGLIAGLALAAQVLSVQVRAGQLREGPGFLNKVITALPYGDRVGLVSEDGDWSKVTSVKQGKTGWMHTSALTEQEIILNPTNKDVEQAAESDELALAGKGFNKQVEEEYQKEKRLDYSKVDAMEKFSVDQKVIHAFIAEGELGRGGKQ